MKSCQVHQKFEYESDETCSYHQLYSICHHGGASKLNYVIKDTLWNNGNWSELERHTHNKSKYEFVNGISHSYYSFTVGHRRRHLVLKISKVVNMFVQSSPYGLNGVWSSMVIVM